MVPSTEITDSLDARFRDAVAAIDAGDISTLERLLAEHPALVHERLESPGAWLRDKVGHALDGFFQRPYLLWFVAEDPVRNGTLPGNIAAVAQLIIDAARRQGTPTLEEQVNYALSLVSWSWIARDQGVQLALIDVLADAGADVRSSANNALVNGNVDAAAHLVKRGADLTLPAALMLGRWDDADRLLARTTAKQKQFAFVLCALHGKADALHRLLAAGVDVNAPSAELYSHGTPLHHAVSSGSLEAVRLLVDAGASVNAVDTAWNGTPLGWALHALDAGQDSRPGTQYAEIAEYLRAR